MNSKDSLKFNPSLIHIIECLFWYEHRNDTSTTKEITTILGCSAPYATALRTLWKKGNGELKFKIKRTKVKTEQIKAKKDKKKHFTSEKACRTCDGVIRYTSNRSCVVCCTMSKEEKAVLKEHLATTKAKQIPKDIAKIKAKEKPIERKPIHFPSFPIINKKERVGFGNTNTKATALQFIEACKKQSEFIAIMNTAPSADAKQAIQDLLKVPKAKARTLIERYLNSPENFQLPILTALVKIEQEEAISKRLKKYKSFIPCAKCNEREKYSVNRACVSCALSYQKNVSERKSSIQTITQKPNTNSVINITSQACA